MTELTDDVLRRLDELAGEMHGAFAELEARGFPLGQICYCAVETAFTRLHKQAPLDETLEWCRTVADVMVNQVELHTGFQQQLAKRAIN